MQFLAASRFQIFVVDRKWPIALPCLKCTAVPSGNNVHSSVVAIYKCISHLPIFTTASSQEQLSVQHKTQN